MKCLCVLQRWSCRKVFHKKKGAERVIFASAVLGERRRWAAATCHWERCTYIGAMKRQRQLSTGQSSHTNSCPLQPSLTLQLPLCVSPLQSVPISVHLSLKHPPPPPPHGPFAVILPPDGTTERASVPLLPSPMTNIYRAALIYSGLISES